MDAAFANIDIDPVLLLNDAVLPQAFETNPKVSGQGVLYVDKYLHRLEAENLLPAVVLADGINLKALFRALAKGATSEVRGVKQAARDGVQRRVSSVLNPANDVLLASRRVIFCALIAVDWVTTCSPHLSCAVRRRTEKKPVLL